MYSYRWVSESRSVMSDFVTPWTVQSMEFSRPEYWSGQPFPSPGDLPNPGIKPRSSALQADSLPAEPIVYQRYLGNFRKLQYSDGHGSSTKQAEVSSLGCWSALWNFHDRKWVIALANWAFLGMETIYHIFLDRARLRESVPLHKLVFANRVWILCLCSELSMLFLSELHRSSACGSQGTVVPGSPNSCFKSEVFHGGRAKVAFSHRNVSCSREAVWPLSSLSGWDGWTASLTQWTWVWTNSGR